MSRYLLDVNLLIALLDSSHILHDRAHAWFEADGAAAWATCPITENGVMRILSHPRYPHTPGNPAIVAGFVRDLRRLSGHQFWPDDLCLVASELIDTKRLLDTGQVTDTYLLALAASHGGQLATLDRRLLPDAVAGGRQALCLL